MRSSSTHNRHVACQSFDVISLSVLWATYTPASSLIRVLVYPRARAKATPSVLGRQFGGIVHPSCSGFGPPSPVPFPLMGSGSGAIGSGSVVVLSGAASSGGEESGQEDQAEEQATAHR